MKPCLNPCPGFPACYLPKGHDGDHTHLDGRCRAEARGVRCALYMAHVGPHEADVLHHEKKVWT